MVLQLSARDKVPAFDLAPSPSATAQRVFSIGEGRVTVTPALATLILAEANYERQRDIKPHRLHRHLVTISKCQWDPDCPIRFARMPNGNLVLVDGQHRLTAIERTGIPSQFLVVITDVQSEKDLHTLYSRIDVDGNRSVADVLNASDPTAGRDISFEMRRHGYQAMGALANGFPHRRLGVGENDLVTKEDRVVCMSYWLDELETYDGIVRAGQSNLRVRLRSPGLVAVGLATLKHQGVQAARFWTAVADNKLLRPGDPEQAMVNFLLTTALNKRSFVAERGAAQAWNAWFNHRRLGTVKQDSDRLDRPFKIDGTPYQGAR